jgi:hypothetical protein
MQMKIIKVNYKDLRFKKRINRREKEVRRFLKLVMMVTFVVFSLSFVYAVGSTSFSNVQYTSPGIRGSYSSSDSSTYWNQLQSAETCSSYNDLLIQIAPLGCTPLIVRSDLLEDQNVPVLCRLEGLRINPSIDISSIRRISFKRNGNSSELDKHIEGIGFHPAQAALRSGGKLTGSPISSNLGYVVIVLKQISSEQNISDFISGNLTAVIHYDAEQAFGIGVGEMYVPVLNEQEWLADYDAYSFWRGRGFVRAESVDENSARVSIYSDFNSRIASFNLQKGASSEKIFLPGEHCRAGIEVGLKSIDYPKTLVKLRINEDEIDAYEGQRILDGRCRISEISSYGAESGNVKISCSGANLDLEIKEYDIQLKLAGQDNPTAHSIGSRINDLVILYSGILQNGVDNTKFIVVKKDTENRLSETVISYLRKKILKSLNGINGKDISYVESQLEALNSSLILITEGNSDSNNEIQFVRTLQPVDADIEIKGKSAEENREVSNAFENTLSNYEEVHKQYDSSLLRNRKAGELALAEAIEFLSNEKIQKEFTRKRLMQEYVKKYPSGGEYFAYKQELDKTNIYDIEKTIGFTEINYVPVRIQLLSIKEPSFEDIGAKIILRSIDGAETNEISAGLNDFLEGSSADSRDYIKVLDISETEVKFKASVIDNGKRIEKSYIVKRGESEIIGNKELFVSSINFKKIALVSLNPKTKFNEQEISFPFSIGIEKRGIKLSPEKMKDHIDWANDSIEKLEELNEKIAEAVTAMKSACLLTRTTMSFKDLLIGSSATDARKWVMRGESGQTGWFAKCQHFVETKQGGYVSIDDCLRKNNDKINKEVADTKKSFEEYNTKKSELSKLLGTSSESGVGVYNLNVDYLKLSYGSSDIYVGDGNQQRSLSEFVQSLEARDLEDGVITENDIQDIIKYSSLIKNSGLNEEISSRLYGVIISIKKRKSQKQEVGSLESNIGVATGRITYFSSKSNTPRTGAPYNYLKLKDLKNINIAGLGVDVDTPVAVIVLGNTSYLYVLEKQGEANLYVEKGVYSMNLVNSKYELSRVNNPLGTGAFRVYDLESYNIGFKGTPKVVYAFAGIPSIVPFDRQAGWYAEINEKTIGECVKQSGLVECLYLGNSGGDGLIGTGDDIKMSFNVNQGINSFPGLSLRETSKLIDNAKEAIRQAMLQKDEQAVIISRPRRDSFPIDKFKIKTNDGGLQCQDFMSPRQCQILFNVCDPVVCPSSRCDLGGKVKVDNVIQSGILGSVALCLPNIKEGIFLPVCLTGIHAGLEGWVSILKNYRDCTQESLETGRNVGICDEIKSFYVCDFFVGQLSSFLSIINTKGGLSAFGAVRDAQQGGGEYLDINNALKNAEESEKYFTTQYAENSKLAFGFKSTNYLSAEVCKMSLSQTYPTDFDAMLEPESPPQFHGWFDEREYSQATVPPTSHYKVFYNIYAGNDTTVGYTIYLTDPPAATEYSTMQRIIVDSGTIVRGQSLDRTKDFTAPAGYKQLCIRINGKDNCGFGKVSTSFALNYMTDSYAEKQAYSPATSEQSCISGKPSVSALVNPNLQAGLEEAISPEMYNQGVVRVCATQNPGKSTDETRWQQVGNCGNNNLKCWLDQNSVKNALSTKNFEGLTLEEIERRGMESLLGQGYLTEEEVNQLIQGLRDQLSSIGSRADLDIVLNSVNALISGTVQERAIFNYQQADALLLKAQSWQAYAEVLFGSKIPDTQKIKTEVDDRDGVPEPLPEFGIAGEDELEGKGIGERVYDLGDVNDLGDWYVENIFDFEGGFEANVGLVWSEEEAKSLEKAKYYLFYMHPKLEPIAEEINYRVSNNGKKYIFSFYWSKDDVEGREVGSLADLDEMGEYFFSATGVVNEELRYVTLVLLSELGETSALRLAMGYFIKTFPEFYLEEDSFNLLYYESLRVTELDKINIHSIVDPSTSSGRYTFDIWWNEDEIKKVIAGAGGAGQLDVKSFTVNGFYNEDVLEKSKNQEILIILDLNEEITVQSYQFFIGTHRLPEVVFPIPGKSVKLFSKSFIPEKDLAPLELGDYNTPLEVKFVVSGSGGKVIGEAVAKNKIEIQTDF